MKSQQQQQQQQKRRSSVLLAAVASVALLVMLVAATGQARPDNSPGRARHPRSDDKHKTMMHNHLSRKVFDRACAASKDSIDEIIGCVTNNEFMIKTIKEETAKSCYKDSFGTDFDSKEVNKHKELICNNREKFEAMTACVYKKSSELMDPKQLDKFTESLVDVGMCIINALDG